MPRPEPINEQHSSIVTDVMRLSKEMRIIFALAEVSAVTAGVTIPCYLTYSGVGAFPVMLGIVSGAAFLAASALLINRAYWSKHLFNSGSGELLSITGSQQSRCGLFMRTLVSSGFVISGSFTLAGLSSSLVLALQSFALQSFAGESLKGAFVFVGVSTIITASLVLLLWAQRLFLGDNKTLADEVGEAAATHVPPGATAV